MQTCRIALPVLLGVMSCAPLRGQLTVRVLDNATGNPVPLAAVSSLQPTGSLIETQSTDLEGVARLEHSEAADRIRVTALGYAAATRSLEGVASVTIRLHPDAMAIDSLTVEVERTGPRPGRIQFSERRGRNSGVFLDPFDVGVKSKYGVVEVFRDLEGVRRTNWRGSRIVPTIVSSLGTGCLLYRLNNLRVRTANWNNWPLSSLLPRDVMAVEIYRYFGEVPVELRGDAWPADQSQPCGLVVIWTREAW